MEEKTKGIGVRLKPELRAKIMEQVGNGRPYPRITDFILAAIEEKIDPELREARERRRIRDMIEEKEYFEHLVELFSQRFVSK